MIEVIVALSAGLVSMFYAIAFCVAAYEIFQKDTTGDVWKDRAVAWLAWSLLCAIIAGAKLRLTDFNHLWVNVMLIGINLAIFIAGLISVYAISNRRNAPVLVFFGLSLGASAALFFFWAYIGCKKGFW